MNKYGIYHITEAPYAYAEDYNNLKLRVRTAKSDIGKCIVYYKDKYYVDSPYQKKEMTLAAQTELFDYFQTNVSTSRNRYEYYFELVDKQGNRAYLNERGIFDECTESYSFIFAYIAHEDVYNESKWLQESTVYQIFVDRFCNGNSEINPENVQPWGKGQLTYRSVYGGDLQGIIDKVDYLKDLGIDVIYLTPIFKANSPHKYDTVDYYSIDPQFGTIDTAKELVRRCHENGMKIIFDAVFNHSSNEFFAFKDVLEKQENSKYKDWYFIDKFPVSFEKGGYYTFGKDFRRMPKLNTNNNEVREYLLNIGEYWVKEVGIDGWRLDVCDEVGHDFWKAFRKRIKAVNKDAVIIGEIMHEANSFLKGDQGDGIMNYPFKNAVTDFFASKTISCHKFSDILAANRMMYMDSITKQMWNLIDSHDTKRFLSECKGDISAMKLAIGFQFTYVGVPYIYYGDEIGMDGEHDPENRRCMIWDTKKQNSEIFDFYKKLIFIRKENKALVYGDYKELYCKDDIVVFKRTYVEEEILVVINNNDENKKIDLNFTYQGVDLINNEKIEINNSLEIGPMNIKIIK